MYSGVHAQSSPRVMSYQGVLRPAGSASGNQTAGTRLLTVTIYGDANGTVKLWQGAMNTLIDSSGVFNCVLGSPDNPLPSPAVMDQPLWLGVAVDGGTELRPLSQMTASPFALNVADNAISTGKLADTAVTTQKLATGAVQSANLADAAVTTAKLADSSITAEKMNMNYVSSISVNGQPATGAGTSFNIVAGEGVNAIWMPDEGKLLLSGTGSNGGMKTLTVASGGLSTPNLCGTNSDGGGANGGYNTVSGGCNNEAIAVGGYSTIGGGQNNEATESWATVGGGDTNVAANYYSTIGGRLN